LKGPDVSEPQQDGTAYPAQLRNDERNVKRQREHVAARLRLECLDLPPKRDQLDYSSARNAFILPRKADHRMEKGLGEFSSRAPFLPIDVAVPAMVAVNSSFGKPCLERSPSFSDAKAFQGGGVTSEPNPIPSLPTLVMINFPPVFQRSAQFLTRSGEHYHDDHVFLSVPALHAPSSLRRSSVALLCLAFLRCPSRPLPAEMWSDSVCPYPSVNPWGRVSLGHAMAPHTHNLLGTSFPIITLST